MRLLLSLGIIVLLAVDGGPGLAQEPASPRLLVVVVVDQFRTDYLSTFAPAWRAGFRRLLTEGAFFERAEYPYLNTVTCAGHATIGTGAYPRTHGMVLNAWWDREARASRACTEDPGATHISYGAAPEPEADTDGSDAEPPPGDSAKSLLVPTLADELREQRRGARVVTLSLKARSAIGLAGHGGAAVTWANDDVAHFVTSRAFAARPVPEVAAFLEKNPLEADARQTWALRDAVETYRYPDASLGARPQESRTGLFPHRIGGPDPTLTDAPFFTLWQVSPYSDAYLARMAIALIDAFDLGQRDTTDFLGVSLSALDLVGHSFGPDSREVEDHLRRLDDTLGGLFDALDREVGRGNWVLGFSSDHGVAPVAVTTGGGRIITQDIGERIEEALLMRFGPRTEGRYVDAVVFNNVYFAPGVYDRLRRDARTYREVERAALGVPGMERLIPSEQLIDSSPDRAVRAAALSHHPARSGDVILVGKPNWYFSPRTDASATTHGTGHAYDRQVPVILLGAGITPGRFSGAASPADIAPTLAHLGGVRLGSAEGRVLREAVR